MIAPVKHPRRRQTRRAWAAFLVMLPAILRHANVILPRRLNPEAREEALQEVACNAAAAYARLVELGKEAIAYPTPLATFAVRQVKDGRRVGNRRNVRDVLSEYAQGKQRFKVERLDHFDAEEGAWMEAVVEDTQAPPDEQAAFRIDFPQWLKIHTARNRRIAESLAAGYTTNEASRKFGVSPGRISQLRTEFAQSWAEFHGEAGAVQGCRA